MKILHILQNYEPSKGGTQLLFKAISEILVSEYGDEITVATTNSLYDPGSKQFSRLPKHSLINGVIVRRFSFITFHRRALKYILKFLFKISGKQTNLFSPLLKVPLSIKINKFIQQYSGDIICGSSSNYTYMDYACKRLRHKKAKPFVFMGAVHFDDEQNIHLAEHVLDNIRCSDKYIANTSFEKECLIRLGIEGEKINVIGCGVHPHFFAGRNKQAARERFGLKRNAFVVGYVGRFAAKKGIETLLRAFSLLQDENCILLLAGATNDYFDNVITEIEAGHGKLKPKIIILSNFAEEDKPDIYAAMDVFVSASYSESFGIVFLEAWAAGLPVVGTSIGAIRSVIDDGLDGRLFRPHEHSELMDILVYYCQHPEIGKQHGEAGLAKVNQKYTWDHIAKAYRETYLEAVALNQQRLCAAS